MDPTRHAVPRAILAVDVEKFSDPTRTEPHKLQVRKGLYDSLERAFVESNIDWKQCYHEDRGDGMFFLLPSDMPKYVLAEYLLRRLVAALLRYNAGCAHGARIRLRVSLHHGDVFLDDQGAVSDALIHTFRLLDAEPLKVALAESSSVLAIIVSESFYREVVRNDPAAEPDSYQPIDVSVKETQKPAWIRLSAETMPDPTGGILTSRQAAAKEVTPEIPLGEESSAELAELLIQVPLVAQAATRRLLLDLLNRLLGRSVTVPYFDDARLHVYSIALTCGRHPGALRALVRALERLQPESPVVHQVRRLVDEMSALDLLDVDDRRQLAALLGGIAFAQVNECFHLAAGLQAATLRSDWRDVLDVVARLEQMNAGANGVPPLLAFVEHLAVVSGDVLATRLWEWSAAQAARMSVSEELEVFRLTVTSSQAADPSGAFDEATLLIRVQPHGLEEGRYLLSEWRQVDATDLSPRHGKDYVCTLAELQARVAELVDQAEGGWAEDAATINVQFILPRELLNLPVDQFMLRSDEVPEPIGVEYQVSIRSLERSRSKQQHRRWRKRWTVLKAYLQAGDGSIEQAVHWSTPEGDKHLLKLGADLASTEKVVVLVLSGPPSSGEVFGTAEVSVALNAGVPVMLWDRRSCEVKEFETAVRTMLMSGGLVKLLENVRLLRGKAVSADDSDAHPGSHLSVLWDDPERMVEPRPEEVVAP